MNDVVVTGVGATTPLAGNSLGHWQGLLEGRSAIATIPHEWAQSFPTRIAATMAVDPDLDFDPRTARRYDRSEKAALVAAREAWICAGLGEEPVPTERLAVCIGTGMGGLTSILEQEHRLRTEGRRKVSVFAVTRTMASGPAACVGVEFRARAGVHSVASACATGAEAIAMGADLIRWGRADVVIAGGVDTVVNAVSLAAFGALRALSTRNDDPPRASRPWDVGRDGFVLGEGAGALILERASRAKSRGAQIFARLAGVGISSDGYDLVHPRPDGAGISAAIDSALHDSNLGPVAVTHVNTHATGTPVGDMIEVAAIRRSVGDHPVLTANKSTHGHLLGAAGAVEAVTTVRSLFTGLVPPTINLENPDPALDLDIVVGRPRRLEMAAALKLSFGFGGQNVALLFARA